VPFHPTEVILQIKRGFGGRDQSTSMRVDFLCDNDPELGISNGRLKFTIEEINGIFEGVTNSILDSCATMISGYDVKVRKMIARFLWNLNGRQNILLVGGFGDSPHLRGRLKERFSNSDIEIVSLNEPWYVV
jgi:hypothetical protein